jgi:hypothetical protein
MMLLLLVGWGAGGGRGSESEVAEMLKAADTDGDGTLDFAEALSPPTPLFPSLLNPLLSA